jgi:hypothetical protein
MREYRPDDDELVVVEDELAHLHRDACFAERTGIGGDR